MKAPAIVRTEKIAMDSVAGERFIDRSLEGLHASRHSAAFNALDADDYRTEIAMQAMLLD